MAKILTVSQLNNYIKGVFDDELILQGISVSGEIFQFKVAGGNSYITLKEGDCTLGCVFFSSAVEYAAGQKVCLTGSVRFYPKSGKVTFIVSHLQLLGRGELLAALEQVRQKLKADGIFDNNRPLPAVVTRVAIVTSEDGAVLHDFLSATKKMPYLSTVLYPVRVQGEGASGEISAVMSDIGKGVLRKDCVILGNLDGFSDFSDMSDMSKFCDFGGLGWSRGSSFGCVVSGFGGKTQAIDCKNIGFGAGFDAGFDAVVIARGGGSAADLDEFNSERLARAVFACGIPVISAVGHQTDYTLCDFAADIRAGTPSIAGEIIADNNRQFMQRLRQNMDTVFGSVVQSLDKNLRRTHRLAGEISHRIAARNQKAQNATMMNVLKVQNQLEIMLQKNRHKTKVVTQNVCDRLCGKAVDGKNKLGVLSARLEESNPLKILSKGYAKICKNGAEISAAGQLSQGDSIQVVMSDGRAFATVDDTELK